MPVDRRMKRTGQKTQAGRPILKTPGGQRVSEKSITVTDQRLNKGRPTNIPSIWRGARRTQEQAIREAVKSGKRFKSYSTIKEAVAGAKARSRKLRPTK